MNARGRARCQQDASGPPTWRGRVHASHYRAVENSSQKSKNTSEVRLAERLYLTIAEAAVLRTCYSRPESQCQNKIIPPG